MEAHQFLDVDEDLLCSICQNVMISPHSCSQVSCPFCAHVACTLPVLRDIRYGNSAWFYQGHAFCFDCISRWMQTATTCPVG